MLIRVELICNPDTSQVLTQLSHQDQVHCKVIPYDHYAAGAHPRKEASDCLTLLEVDEAICLETLGVKQGAVDLILAAENRGSIARQAIKLGAADFLYLPIGADELFTALVDVAQQRERSQNSVSLKQSNKTSVIMGCKGGVGATLLAYNVAQLLAEKVDDHVMLLDLNLQYASTATMLNSAPPHSVVKALHSASHLDNKGILGYRLRHESGLGVFAANQSETTLMEELPAHNVECLIDHMKAVSDHLIIDLPNSLNLLTLGALQKADSIYLVVQQDIAHIANAIKQLKVMREELYIQPSQIHLLINRYNPSAVLKEDDIAEALGIKHVHVLPSAFKLVMESLNETKPIHQLSPNNPLSKGVLAIAESMVGGSLTKKRGLWSKISNLFSVEGKHEYSID